MRPNGALIEFRDIAGNHRWPMKNIAGLSKNISPIIKRNSSQCVSYRDAQLEVCDRQAVAAKRYGERIENYRVAIAFTIYTGWDDDHAGARLFKIKASQG